MNVSSVSYSSDKKLVRCEYQFFYRYNQRLKPRLKSTGLFRGDWMHQLQSEHHQGKDWKPKFHELVQKKWDKLFDEEKENYGVDFPEATFALMRHYADYWKDDWTVLHNEKRFSLLTKFGFPIVWQSDLIVKQGKKTVLVETKNKKKIPESEERMLAPQVHGYCFLLSKVGVKIDEIIWNYIRTEPLPRPQLLKNGTLSKRKIETDRRTFLAAIKEYGITPDVSLKKHIASLPETLSLVRVTNSPNMRVGEIFVREWVERARRAQSIRVPTHNLTRSCRWECDYTTLCQIDLQGKLDRELEIKKNFVRIGDIKNA